MLQNKMLQWLIMILIAITLIVLAGFVLWDYMDRKSADPATEAASSVTNVKAPAKKSAAEVKELTVQMPEILTNLSNKQFVKVSFAFELENKKAKEEFENLDFRVKSIIIQTLADMTAEQVSGKKGQDNLKAVLINNLNGIFSAGKIAQIDITNIVIN
ncbi:flagellar basal body-associated FliL family protein [Paenibacillus sp. y28]|uniref:flagellar basal body-associated FliL family protein n=1 Tax=Paenibacillus sp. y28 TaxID=3129110 RepID=UPI00301A5867